MRFRESRLLSFAAIGIVYILSAAAGVVTYNALSYDFWLKLLIADVVATFVVFVFSAIFDNASVYDPCWSVQPIVKGGLNRTGLWKYARHPNYLGGEIASWWCIALTCIPALPGRWYLCAGAVANTLLFLFVSIPMADKRQSESPAMRIITRKPTRFCHCQKSENKLRR